MKKDLIERLEKATEGSRELDAGIAQLVGTSHGPREHVDIEARSVTYIDEQAKFYTTSLDAAMTLVPEGMVFAIDQPDDVKRELFYANVRTRGPNKTFGYAYALSAPLALCIAALRARDA